MAHFASRQQVSWIFIGVLTVCCAVLGILQYRWTYEIGEAERDRLRESLRTRMEAFARGFDTEIAAAARALVPTRQAVAEKGREGAWRDQYLEARRSHSEIFRGAALVYPAGGELRRLGLEPSTAAAPVPREALFPRDPDSLVLEVFDQPDGPEWLQLELNRELLRTSSIPRLLQLYLGEDGAFDYDAQISTGGPAPELIYSTGADAEATRSHADAVVPLLNVQLERGRGFPFGGRRGPGPPGARGGPPPGGRGERRGPPPGPERAPLWQLSVRHHAGSLEALVSGTVRRNLAVSGGILLLIVGASALLLTSSRRAQRLADLQMEFVAGVSHELRTPLSVIRTAAYNLRDLAFRERPEQVEKYGRLIESETARLETMMEQVLRFASLNSGQPLLMPQPVSLDAVVREELELRRPDIERAHIVVEERLGSSLPAIQADPGALRHVVRNLIDNALKHAPEGRWIGVSTQAVGDENGQWVELRVADRGAGIPRQEQSRIFNAFERGSAALRKQVRGTGLGLSLVRTIAERHGGSIRVESGLERAREGGAEFILRLPA